MFTVTLQSEIFQASQILSVVNVSEALPMCRFNKTSIYFIEKIDVLLIKVQLVFVDYHIELKIEYPLLFI